MRPDRQARLLPALMLGIAAALPATSLAHDYRVGALRIDHPYATPSTPGAAVAAAYLRAIRNTGDAPDRLVGASTAVAGSVEIHHSRLDAQNIMRMRAVEALELPARGEVRLRHGGEHHLMLLDLKRPLKPGDEFALTLRFERAGPREVKVQVVQPRDEAASSDHKH